MSIPSIPETTVEELKKMMDDGVDFQLVDVRESFEYDHSHLNGVHIPLADVVLDVAKIEKDKPVIIHCRSGKRSAQAIMLLQREGFTNLSNLKGGILAWKEEIDSSLDVY